MNPKKVLKLSGNTNPITTQCYGADPYALVYGDTIYIYMTADAYEYDTKGEITENTYSKIRSIHVVSTKDMKNFTDHGEIPVAGEDGIAKWAHNSWAPAAAWKNINGKDEFFLYFADNGGGIGVLKAESPTGPFIDPLGHGLITRDVPTCDKVAWLFDPAVLVDDDGTGYIYFGGGVPMGMFEAPGTGRVARLNDDMISLACDPVPLDVPFLFEDSGIHKFNNKYYYTYCTNFNVSKEGTEKYGFENGEISCLVSDNPMGPFKFQERILKNPEVFCGLGGNNHHAVFSFNGEWYIVYHSRMLEKALGVQHGYRVTSIEKFTIASDGTIGCIPQTYEGPDRLRFVNPFEENSAVCVSQMIGTNAVPASDALSYKDMVLGEIDTDDYIEVTGVDFKEGASSLVVTAKVPDKVSGKIVLRSDDVNGADLCTVELVATGDKYSSFTAPLTDKLSGIHNLFFPFEGSKYTVSSWKFA